MNYLSCLITNCVITILPCTSTYEPTNGLINLILNENSVDPDQMASSDEAI